MSVVQFETPENVEVQYQPAGPGTRFIAWFVDQIFVWVLIFAILILLAIAGVSFDGVFETSERDPRNVQSAAAYFVGFAVLITGLGSFLYFTGLEIWLRGQTIGKRFLKIRVVKANGFALDAGSIFLRNVFRLLDNIPLTWIVPLMSKRTQRCGDLVAGTVVVTDELPELTYVRSTLAERNVSEAEFRFDARALSRLTESDFEAVERLLERWTDLPAAQRELLVARIVRPLVTKMRIDSPPGGREHRFLEDLLAADIRRQGRLLN